MELLPAQPRFADTSRPADLSRAPEMEGRQPVIPSARLLRGESSVMIDHEGMQYILRATRTGKLILTK